MGTRSKTTVFDENNKPLLSFYCQFDGYYDGHGAELQKFLKDMVIVDGYGSHTPAKVANGMGCLAAQLIKHFKEGIGGIYICSHDDCGYDDNQEYNYEIRYVSPKLYLRRFADDTAKVSLKGTCEYDKPKTFRLYDEIIPSNILYKCKFVYDKEDGERAKWRVVEVTGETVKYLEGIEKGKFKRFLRSKILEGQVIKI